MVVTIIQPYFRQTYILHGEVKHYHGYITSHPKSIKMEKIVKILILHCDITKMLKPNKHFMPIPTLVIEGILMPTKILLMLFACDADNRQLATFMNTTVERPLESRN